MGAISMFCQDMVDQGLLSPFELNGRKKDISVIFLTYVQDDTKLDKKIIRDFLKTKKFDQIMVAEERTQEGKLHHHALCYKISRMSIYHVNAFDIEGEHPHIMNAKKTDMPVLVDYLMKECRGKAAQKGKPGTEWPITYGFSTDDYSRRVSRTAGVTVAVLDDIIEGCENIDEAKDALRSQKPSVRDWNAAVAYMKDKFPPVNPYYRSNKRSFRTSDMYEYHPRIKQFFDLYVNCEVKKDRYPILVISGLTRRHKSTAISKLGPHLYFRNDVDVCAFANVPSDVKFILMDDINLDNQDVLFKNNALMLGSHDGWNEKFLYIGKQQVENPVPVIWLCNKFPEAVSKDCDKYNCKGYYYKNSWCIRINRHMAKLPHRYMGDKFREAWKDERFRKSVTLSNDDWDTEKVELSPRALEVFFKDVGDPLGADPLLVSEFSNYTLEELLAEDEVDHVTIMALDPREVKGPLFNPKKTLKRLEEQDPNR
jgi:hypothetical protein